MTAIRRGLIAGLLLATVGGTFAYAADQPGDPCTKPGQIKPLGSGAIECVNGAWAPSTSAAPATGGTPSGSSKAGPSAKVFTTIGTALTQATFGSSGKQVADASALRLADGRIRIIAWVNPVGLRNATSTDSSGTSFVADSTTPLPSMAGQPRMMRIDAKTVRLFYVSAGTISTAISTDEGQTFTEQGPVITTAQAGFEPGTLTVVKTGKVYRGYFSNLEKPGERAPRVMRTATSTDLINWTMGPKLAIAGSHPFALSDGKSKVTLYFAADGASSYGIYAATSKNGTSFATPKMVIAGAGDPDIVALSKSSWRMYYGTEISADLGFGVKVAKSIANPML